jgi:hypothetical protein
LLVTASVVLSSPILVTLMKGALGSSETSVLTRAARRNIPEDAILHNHRRENLKSYMFTDVWENSTASNLRCTLTLEAVLSSEIVSVLDCMQSYKNKYGDPSP